jgi:hypothetical protein
MEAFFPFLRFAWSTRQTTPREGWVETTKKCISAYIPRGGGRRFLYTVLGSLVVFSCVFKILVNALFFRIAYSQPKAAIYVGKIGE